MYWEHGCNKMAKNNLTTIIVIVAVVLIVYYVYQNPGGLNQLPTPGAGVIKNLTSTVPYS